MNVGAGAAGEAVEEIEDQLGLQIAHQPHPNLGVNHGGAASAKIHGDHAQRFVHRHQEISRAQDSAFVAERPVEGLAQGDADILHRVVLIDIEIAAGRRVPGRSRRDG